MAVYDARGLACPEPVMIARRALAGKEASYQILVDNNTAKENVTRYAEHQGYRVSVEEKNGEFTLNITR